MKMANPVLPLPAENSRSAHPSSPNMATILYRFTPNRLKVPSPNRNWQTDIHWYSIPALVSSLTFARNTTAYASSRITPWNLA